MRATLYLMHSEMGSQCSFFRRGRVVMTRYHEDESCSKVLNFLERLDDRTGCAHMETVTVIKHNNHLTVQEPQTTPLCQTNNHKGLHEPHTAPLSLSDQQSHSSTIQEPNTTPLCQTNIHKGLHEPYTAPLTDQQSQRST